MRPQDEKRSWPTDDLFLLLVIIGPILFTLYLIFGFTY
jgi:hypothetical protein